MKEIFISGKWMLCHREWALGSNQVFDRKCVLGGVYFTEGRWWAWSTTDKTRQISEFQAAMLLQSSPQEANDLIRGMTK